MNRKNLMIAAVLIGGIIILSAIAVFIFNTITDSPLDNSTFAQTNAVFNAKNPEEKAKFIARLTRINGFERLEGTDKYIYEITNVSLTPDGKYWIVKMHDNQVNEDLVVTINAKTLMSKVGSSHGEFNIWISLDELIASYIAEIQSIGDSSAEIHKINMEGKEIWKITYTHHVDDDYPETGQVQEIYVDVKTGKSKNTWDEFNKAAGTNDWKTLKQVDNAINNRSYPETTEFKDALRDLYPE